ncbi:nucleotidyltransferase family protein [Phenylobacterium sp.]|uniref:nucleotidyltransferase family protein n=1 Tax=Phenylobacterium sp. TaxID=1871053 RepID=UPI0037C8FD16
MSSERLQEALGAVRRRQAQAAATGIELVGVVGSVARGDDNPNSDVDVAYRVVGPADLFDLGGLLMDLRDDLHGPVDLVDIDHARPRMKARLERDLVKL